MSKRIIGLAAVAALAIAMQPAHAAVITYSFTSNPGLPPSAFSQVNSGNIPNNTQTVVSSNPLVSVSGSFSVDTSLLGGTSTVANPGYYGLVNYQNGPQAASYLTGQISIPQLGLPGFTTTTLSSSGLVQSFSASGGGGPLNKIEISSSVCSSTFWDAAETIQKTLSCESVTFNITSDSGVFFEDGFQLPNFVPTGQPFSFYYFRSSLLYNYDEFGGWIDYVAGSSMANGQALVSISSNAVPEPMTLTLFAGGLGLVGAARRRRRAA